MSCKSCGAPIDRRETACPYCGRQYQPEQSPWALYNAGLITANALLEISGVDQGKAVALYADDRIVEIVPKVGRM